MQPRVREARFGDGYSQRTPDGLNPLAEEWSLVFEEVDDAIGNDIEDFLEARDGAEAFDWTPIWAVASPIRVICRQWRRVRVTNYSSTITATFERVYEP